MTMITKLMMMQEGRLTITKYELLSHIITVKK